MTQTSEFTIDFDADLLQVPPTPIVEAIIRWQASPGAVVERNELQRDLEQRFSEYAIHAQYEINGPMNDSKCDEDHGRRAQTAGLRLISNDKKYVCQFRPNEIIFSRLAPYEDWNSFIAEALRFWEAFVELAAPERVQRMAVRFICQWHLNEGQHPTDLVNEPSAPLQSIGLLPSGFFRQDTMLIPNYPYGVHLRRALHESDPPLVPDRSLIVDIDVFTTRELDLGKSELNCRLNEMRFVKNKILSCYVK